jgi:hypothetical protein
METEASVTAMAEEMERLRDLPSESEDDDLGDDEVDELFGRQVADGARAVAGEGAAAEDLIDLEGKGDAGKLLCSLFSTSSSSSSSLSVSVSNTLLSSDAEEDGENDGAGQVSRPCTSDVWEDFRKLFKTGPKGKQIRYGAVCIHCKK